MARMYFLHGLTVVEVISNPANLTHSAKWNFSGLTDVEWHRCGVSSMLLVDVGHYAVIPAGVSVP